MAINRDDLNHINRNTCMVLEEIARSRKTTIAEKISLSILRLKKATNDYVELRKALDDSQR